VTQFVDECRREWKRLGVPDAVADEMAAELTADLAEAAAEGAPVEDVLGRSASDPRGLAAAWAAARGAIGGPAHGQRLLGTAAAIAALALVAIVGSVLLIRSSDSSPARLALLPPPPARIERQVVTPTTERQIWVTAAPAQGDARQTTDSDDAVRTAGFVLSIAALGGIVLLASAWLWRSRRARS
jgi:hypothetical protein